MKIRFGTNFLIFILFFGIATLDALQAQNWPRAGFWLLIGAGFLWADNVLHKSRTDPITHITKFRF